MKQRRGGKPLHICRQLFRTVSIPEHGCVKSGHMKGTFTHWKSWVVSHAVHFALIGSGFAFFKRLSAPEYDYTAQSSSLEHSSSFDEAAGLNSGSDAYSDPAGLRWQWRKQYRSQRCRQRWIFHRGFLSLSHMWLEQPPDRCFHWRPKQSRRVITEQQAFHCWFILQHFFLNKHLMWWTCKFASLS